jgi:hypothetical protein
MAFPSCSITALYGTNTLYLQHISDKLLLCLPVEFKVLSEYGHHFGVCWFAANKKSKSHLVLSSVSSDIAMERARFTMPLIWHFSECSKTDVLLMFAIGTVIKVLLLQTSCDGSGKLNLPNWVIWCARQETHPQSTRTTIKRNKRKGREESMTYQSGV